jgi:5-methylcytosine-specific restriction endonuclease McrA
MQDIANLFEQSRHGNGYINRHSDKESPVILDYFDCVLDHITPLSKGGMNTPDNLCITSKRDNARKGSKSLHQWEWELRAKGIRAPYMSDDISVQMSMF